MRFDFSGFRSPEFLAGSAVWIGAMALYLSTLAPTLTWGLSNYGVDGGDLLAAANTWGVPHPPGYPTYTVLLKVFATLVPVGDFAFRGNLLSAVLASSAVVLLYAAILRVCAYLVIEASRTWQVGSAALGASVFATSPLFWSQAVITEVYTLNACFGAALLFVALRTVLPMPTENPGRVNRDLAVFAFLLGIGLGNHLTLLAIAAPLGVWMTLHLGWRRIVSPWMVGPLLLGLAVYVYLPIRAAQTPPVNWGGADSFGGFAWTITGRPYQDYVLGLPASAVLNRLTDWLELTFEQFNPLGLFFGLIAVVPLKRILPGLLWSTLATIVLISVYAVSYYTIDFQVLAIPAVLAFSVWVGAGFYWILAAWIRPLMLGRSRADIRRGEAPGIERYRPALVLTTLAFLLLPVVAITLNYGSQDLSDDRTALDHAISVADSVPPGSVLISNQENNVFSQLYMQYVERPDSNVVPIAVPLLQFDWYLEDLHHRYPDRIPADLEPHVIRALEDIVAYNIPDTPVYFTFGTQLVGTTFDLQPAGKVYQAVLKFVP